MIDLGRLGMPRHTKIGERFWLLLYLVGNTPDNETIMFIACESDDQGRVRNGAPTSLVFVDNEYSPSRLAARKAEEPSG